VLKGLKEGAVYVFGYHGKLQEVMQILRNAEISVPYVMPETVFHVSRVAEKHGMNLGKLLLSTEREAHRLLENNLPCLAFYHMESKGTVGLNNFRICVSGWEFDSAIRQTDHKEYLVALSDHSDFNGLLEYVRRSKPQLVITDNFRVSNGETLAKEIHKHFGISAVALPRRTLS
jgi:putative mRNA 3-end processing factor